MPDYDLAVIGGGAAGFAAATKANDLGKSVVLINDGLPIGGTCVNVGCVPSKHLLHLAELAHRPQHPGWPAVGAVTPRVDFAAAIRGTGALVETLRGTNYIDVINSLDRAAYVEARARFMSPTEIEAGGNRYTARTFLIATGSRPVAPPIPGLREAGFWTNREALQADHLPADLVVIGAGPIGLELGQAFLRFGSRVTVLEMADQVLPRFEPLIANELERALVDEGMAIHTSAKVAGVRIEGGRKVVLAEIDGQARDFPCDEILVATGVRPNTEDLGLGAAGVHIDARGFVETDAQLRTSNERVYAAGDVTGHGFLETLAAKEGAVAAENGLTGTARTINYEHIPSAVFTDPQVASVGITEAQEMERWNACSCRHVEVARIPKAQAVGDRYGVIQLVAHPETSVLVGAHMVAPMAADLIHEATLAVKFGLSVDDLIDTVHVFPTHSEGIKLAAQAYVRDISVMACCIG
ncbi:MAG: mercury(II) reductase [Dehalococcoidia bacterium]|nr:MAG: mercury(II) reductase [Dehalococcoidia bacterium]